MSVVGAAPPPPAPITPDVSSAPGQIGADFSQALFNQINANPQDGGISKSELQSYLQNQGISYDSAQFDKVFEQADISDDDYLSYQEIEAAWDDFSQLGSAAQPDQGQNDTSNPSEQKGASGEQGNSGEQGKSCGQGSGQGSCGGGQGSGGSEGAQGAEGASGAGGAGGAGGGFSLASLWEYLLGKYDKNGDGKIDGEELAALKEDNPELGEKIDGLLEKAGIDPASGITQEKLEGAVKSGKITEAELKTVSEGLGME